MKNVFILVLFLGLFISTAFTQNNSYKPIKITECSCSDEGGKFQFRRRVVDYKYDSGKLKIKIAFRGNKLDEDIFNEAKISNDTLYMYHKSIIEGDEDVLHFTVNYCYEVEYIISNVDSQFNTYMLNDEVIEYNVRKYLDDISRYKIDINGDTINMYTINNHPHGRWIFRDSLNRINKEFIYKDGELLKSISTRYHADGYILNKLVTHKDGEIHTEYHADGYIKSINFTKNYTSVRYVEYYPSGKIKKKCDNIYSENCKEYPEKSIFNIFRNN